MNSNRMRPIRTAAGATIRLEREWSSAPPEDAGPIDLDGMPAPLAVEKVAPERIVADILVATLSRVQNDSSPEIAAAAEKYINVLRRKQ